MDLEGRQLLYSHRFVWFRGEKILASFDEIDGVGVDSAAVEDPDTGENSYYNNVVVLLKDTTKLRMGMRQSARSVEELNQKAKVMAKLMDSKFFLGSPGVSLKGTYQDGKVKRFQNNLTHMIVKLAWFGFLIYLAYELIRHLVSN